MPDKQYSQRITLLIFECIIDVHCNSAHLISILENVYGAMQIADSNKLPDIKYTINFNHADGNTIIISRKGIVDLIADNIGEFIFFLEKDMTIKLQKIRADLLFIHSAALEYQGKGLLLVAPSGTGKSTTAWGLINTGFNYLSDELAPIDLNTMMIHSYPHAICLKARPPMFELPDSCLVTSQTMHVYGESFSASIQHSLTPLKAIIFLEYHPEILQPEISPMSRAEASANLYANSLNILAHDKSDYGMEAAIIMATEARNYRLFSNQLDKTCDKLKSLIQSIE
jgi:hypothetical protein